MAQEDGARMDVDPRLQFLFDAMRVRAEKRIALRDLPKAFEELGLFVEDLACALHACGFRSDAVLDWGDEFGKRNVTAASNASLGVFSYVYGFRNVADHSNYDKWPALKAELCRSTIDSLKACLPTLCGHLEALGANEKRGMSWYAGVAGQAFQRHLARPELAAVEPLLAILLAADEQQAIVAAVDAFMQTTSAPRLPKSSERFSVESRLAAQLAALARMGAGRADGTLLSDLSARLRQDFPGRPVAAELEKWETAHGRTRALHLLPEDFGVLRATIDVDDDGYAIASVQTQYPWVDSSEVPERQSARHANVDALYEALIPLLDRARERVVVQYGEAWRSLGRYVVQLVVPDEALVDEFEAARRLGQGRPFRHGFKSVTTTRRSRYGAAVREPLRRPTQGDAVLRERLVGDALFEAVPPQADRLYACRHAWESDASGLSPIVHAFDEDIALAVLDASGDLDGLLEEIFRNEESEDGLALATFFDRVKNVRGNRPLRLLWHDTRYSNRLHAA